MFTQQCLSALFDGIGLGQIAGHRACRPAGIGDELNRFRQRPGPAAANYDLGASPGEINSDGAANAGAAPCHERGLTLQRTHAVFPLLPMAFTVLKFVAANAIIRAGVAIA